MSIRRSADRPNDHFTIVSNDFARDGRLSFKARGIAVYLLSHDVGFTTDTDAIASAGQCGLDLVRGGLKELERYGYLARARSRDDQGRLAGTDYTITDRPIADQDGENLRGKTQRRENLRRETRAHKKTNSTEDQNNQEDPTPSANADASTATEPEPDGALFGSSERVVPISQKADAGFERWWGIYPRREGKQAARKSFDKALRAVDLDRLCAGAERYARHVKFSDRRYIKQPTTWLNQGCWDDELGAPPLAAAASGAPNRIRDFKSPALEDQGAYDEAW